MNAHPPALNRELRRPTEEVPQPFEPNDAEGAELPHAALSYWLPGELTVQPLFFDRLELPHDGDLAP